MKNVVITFSILFAGMLLVSQAEARSGQSHHAHLLHEAAYAGNDADEFGAEFGALMQDYFGLKEALVESDLEQAGSKSHAMGERLDEIGPHRLEGDEHMFWMNRFEDLAGEITAIHDAENLDDVREHFSSLSDQLVEIVSTLGTGDNVYHQYCPMAEAGWLSDEEEIRNPYKPETMLGCGRIEAKM
ncbi:DUF3347 domain-containing protein [Natronogracilivirga saccharolytica]|uniref:DUF3347 domain-containing protein n=1 Tax=Natronogracilivirga saccharolytica TaxID=2812953 RepID=A0A8J7RSD7_9BACT|nr:DUF3347 domain-containing protein [Natronogracilivirga saccharolytica]MBP3192072.1 DUF3347 domain-containing protein [Natronogracilivirga saccharolytica]